MIADHDPFDVDLTHADPFELGPLTVRPSTRELVVGDRREVLEPRVMQVLVALASRRGEVVSRDDLITACWRARTVVGAALTRCIVAIRRLARDHGGFTITTVARVGYRLDDAAGLAAESAAPEGARQARKPSICVLPFTNMSEDPGQDYFSDGISEDIITDLSKVSALFVVARNTAFQFKGTAVDVTQVARQLKVGYVLEGSVRRSTGRVRIVAQLIDGATGGHVWAERYDRAFGEIFALQDEIAQAIVGALRVELLPEEKRDIERRGTTSSDAYNLYLMASKYSVSGNHGDMQGMEANLRLCRRATEIDPNYARAWALMAQFQHSLHSRFGGAKDGMAALERALLLDPDLADAHAFKARHLFRAGLYDEAFAEIEVAVGLDGESYEVNESAANLYFKRQRFTDAIRHGKKAAALMETSYAAPGNLINYYGAVGDQEGACRAARMTRDRAEKALARDPSDSLAMSAMAIAFAVLGERELARAWIDRAMLIDPDSWLMRYNCAAALSRYLDDTDAAIGLLGPVFPVIGRSQLYIANMDPDMDRLRDDPRFQAMVAAAEARLAAAEASGASTAS